MQTTDLSKLIINQLTEEQYQAAKTAGILNPNELYFTEADSPSAFIATYGTTTFAEIKDAYDSGCAVFCTRSDNSVKYVLTGLTSTTAYFFGIGTSSNIVYRIYVDSTWHAASATFVSTTDKGVVNGVASLDSSGKVPSAQLPDAVQNSIIYTKLGRSDAVSENNTNLSTAMARGIVISNREPTASDGAVGQIWIVYQE